MSHLVADALLVEPSGADLRFLSAGEAERLAALRLPSATWGYFASGARDQHTLAENRQAFDRLRLYPRVLVDVSRRDMGVTLLGERLPWPVLVAPMAFQRLAHPEGELAAVRAAGAAGSVYVLSTLATTPVEAVVAAATGPVWFQLYVYRDRGATRGLVERAEAAGCRALVVTVDAPVLGAREADQRSGFHLPPGLRAENLVGAGHGELPPEAGGSGLAAYVYRLLDPSLSWDDIAWLRGITRLPVIVKGVLRDDDARLAVEAGVDGLIVSNHGGRQLDHSPATIDALPAIAEAVAGRVPLLLDGGVRRGTDVVKALALGAQAVLVGRPVLHGLALGGEAGAARILGLLRAELDEAMALIGAPTLSDLPPRLVR